MSFDNGPLAVIRQGVAATLQAAFADELTVYPNWTANFTTPAVILNGAGWEPWTGCSMNYNLQVTVIVADQSGLAPSKTEEATRQVWDVLAQNNYTSQAVPAPGVVTVGDRDYPACQFTIPVLLNPKED